MWGPLFSAVSRHWVGREFVPLDGRGGVFLKVQVPQQHLRLLMVLCRRGSQQLPGRCLVVLPLCWRGAIARVAWHFGSSQPELSCSFLRGTIDNVRESGRGEGGGGRFGQGHTSVAFVQVGKCETSGVVGHRSHAPKRRTVPCVSTLLCEWREFLATPPSQRRRPLADAPLCHPPSSPAPHRLWCGSPPPPVSPQTLRCHLPPPSSTACAHTSTARLRPPPAHTVQTAGTHRPGTAPHRQCHGAATERSDLGRPGVQPRRLAAAGVVR